jgi:hypothetical protein
MRLSPIPAIPSPVAEGAILAGPAIEAAGRALADLGEEMVLLACYRGENGHCFSVRLGLDGAPTGVQESAATAAEALARTRAARDRKRRELALEAALRAEIGRWNSRPDD